MLVASSHRCAKYDWKMGNPRPWRTGEMKSSYFGQANRYPFKVAGPSGEVAELRKCKSRSSPSEVSEFDVSQCLCSLSRSLYLFVAGRFHSTESSLILCSGAYCFKKMHINEALNRTQTSIA